MSSLSNPGIEPQGRHRGRHTSVPRSDSNDDTPEFWGEPSGDCVSASGRVRREHGFLEGSTCIFCGAVVRADGSITLTRPGIQAPPDTFAPPPPAASRWPGLEHKPAAKKGEVRRQKKAEEDEFEVIECPNCAGVIQKFFMGHEITHCPGCEFELLADQEDEDEAPPPTRRCKDPRKPKKGKKK